MQIKIGTKLFERFQNIPIALRVKFHFFNITNKELVMAGLERPKFEEVGPFLFEQRRKRHVVDIEDNGRKLRFRETKYYYSVYGRADDETLSRLNASEKLDQFGLDPRAHKITIVNLPLLSVLTKLADLPEGSLKRSLAAKVAKRLVEDGNDKILVTKAANELLFDGYKVDFMEAARELFLSLGFNFESPLPANKFGFFFLKNGTWTKREGGEYLIHTGRHGSMADFPRVASWNDLTQLSIWPNDTRAGDRCNRIYGTDGSSFHPGLNRNQHLHVFSPLICTSIYFKYREDTQVNGIPVWRYTTPPDVFAAPGKNDKNACYCTIRTPQSRSGPDRDNLDSLSQESATTPVGPAINNSRCFIDGILDLSLCQRGAPIAVSGAHFYNADPMLALASGLKPEKAKHETFLDVEPMTGAVMRASSKAQMSAFVEEAALNIIDSNVTGRMTPMIAPLLWLEEAAEINDKLANEFKGQLLTFVQKANRSFIYMIIIGALIMAVVALNYWYCFCYGVDLKKIHEQADRRAALRLLKRIKKQEQARGKGHLHDNIKSSLNLDHDDQDETYNRKNSDSLLDEHVGTAAIAGAMGAIGAKLPHSSDKHRLIDDESDDHSTDEHRGQTPTTEASQGLLKSVLEDSQKPSTSHSN